MDNIRDKFRQNLKTFRTQNGFSQEELSRKCNYDRTYIGKIERGAADPSLESIERVAEAMDVSPLSLLLPADEQTNELPLNLFDTAPYLMAVIEPGGELLEANDNLTNQIGDRTDVSLGAPLWELPLWAAEHQARKSLEQHTLEATDGNDPSDMIVRNQDGDPTTEIIVYPADDKLDHYDLHIVEIRPTHPLNQQPIPLHSVDA